MIATRPSTDILLALPPVPDAVRSARHALDGRGMASEMHHTVALLISEVMGNAVRHAHAPHEQIIFHARIGGDHIRIEVADRGEGFDPEIRHDAAGFGLRLVDKLASRWGVERTARGCRVWFEVDHRAGRFDHAAG